MGRYSQIPVRRTLKGKRYFATNRYPNIPLSSNDIYVITTIGDRYDTLANQYYKNSTYWWVISIANNTLKQDISSILSQYESINNFPSDNSSQTNINSY